MLDVFEERKVEAYRWSKLPQPSVHFHACSFLLSGVDVVHRENSRFRTRREGHDLEVVRPLNEIESAPRVKLAVASRWVNRSINPSNTLAQHLLDCEVYLSTHEVFSKNSAILHIHEAPFRAYSVRTYPSLAAREMRSSQQAGYGSKRKGHE
jgi:hypothetical protein